MDLKNRKCIPCEGGVKSLSKSEVRHYIREISNEWKLLEEAGVLKIKRSFKFSGFKEAISFVNKVAVLAESEGHHPNIFIYYNKVDLELYTHAIKGLHENDFIIAGKVEKLV